MGKVMIITGILLLLFGTACFALSTNAIMLASSQWLTSLLAASNLCEDFDLVAADAAGDASQDGSRPAAEFYCVNKEGIRYEVDSSFRNSPAYAILRSIGGYLFPVLASAPCVVGVLLILFGGLSVRRNRLRMVAIRNEVLQDDSLVMTEAMTTMSPEQHKQLADRLRQIDEARQSGKLNAKEYERLRREALNDMT